MKATQQLLLTLILVCAFSFGKAQVQDSLPFNPAVEDSLYEAWAMQYAYVSEQLNEFPDSIPSLGDIDNVELNDSIIKVQLEELNKTTPFSLIYNDRVLAFIKLYLKRKDLTGRILGLSDYYFPMIEAKLSQNDVPLEMKYLAIVESALKPAARSRAGAVGLWQFMYYTGKLYKLNVTSYTDERRNPEKATDAACAYLTDLYNMFDNWEMALAAYNSGPGNVRKAIRYAGGKKSYWEIYPYLPRETRSYVPAFIAVNFVMAYHKEYGITPIKPDYYYHQVDTTMVTSNLAIDYFSEALAVDKETLIALNPDLKSNVIPGAVEPYALKLPLNASLLYASIKDSLVEQYKEDNPEIVAYKEVDQYKTHYVRRGEVLGSIARRYGVSVNNLKSWNRLRSHIIRPGQKLVVYQKQRVAVTASKKEEPKKQASETASTNTSEKTTASNTATNQSFKYYTVQPGDTLWGIAKKFNGISVDELKKINDLGNARKLKPGQKLKISERI